MLLQAPSLVPPVRRPFNFQNMWLKRKGFQKVVEDSWALPLESYKMLKFSLKLQRHKGTLKKWNAKVFGNVKSNVQKVEEYVSFYQRSFEASGSDSDLMQVRAKEAELCKFLAEEEVFWLQKSRIKWLAEGDRNTKYFHSVSWDHRRRYAIFSIKDSSGTVVKNQKSIRDMVAQFYQTLLAEEGGGNEDREASERLLVNIPQLVSQGENAELEKGIEEEELKQAVWDLDPDSAPGSEGFPGTFYRGIWDIIREDLFDAVKELMAGVPLPRAVASTLITLIPKK